MGIAEVWESGPDNKCSGTRERGKGPLLCSVQPTRPDRGWFVAPFGKNPWWVYLASILPALLVTILIFMDQQITAVIVNRKENKLRVSLVLGGRGTETSHSAWVGPGAARRQVPTPRRLLLSSWARFSQKVVAGVQLPRIQE